MARLAADPRSLGERCYRMFLAGNRVFSRLRALFWWRGVSTASVDTTRRALATRTDAGEPVL